MFGETRSTLILTTVFAEAVTPAPALLMAKALSAAESEAESPIATPLIVTLSLAASTSVVYHSRSDCCSIKLIKTDKS